MSSHMLVTTYQWRAIESLAAVSGLADSRFSLFYDLLTPFRFDLKETAELL